MGLAPAEAGANGDLDTVGGLLDSELAWRTWERERLGIDRTPGDVDLLVEVAGRPDTSDEPWATWAK